MKDTRRKNQDIRRKAEDGGRGRDARDTDVGGRRRVENGGGMGATLAMWMKVEGKMPLIRAGGTPATRGFGRFW